MPTIIITMMNILKYLSNSLRMDQGEKEKAKKGEKGKNLRLQRLRLLPKRLQQH